MRRAVALSGMLWLGVASAGTAAPPATQVAPVITVQGGTLRGTLADGVASFKDIPYAAPPVGALRWRPPAPPLPWSGVRDATAYGPACPQLATHERAAMPMSEDCLTLNIFEPANAVAAGKAHPLPVMVWLFGGGFIAGAPSEPVYQGTALARHGVVLVTINYRLGVLGWLANAALSAESPDHVSGNYGLLDQLAALDWVRHNASRFGGDPSNVTLFGQSAGAISVRALLIAPSARGLFQRAILESPAGGYKMTTLAQAEEAGAIVGSNAATMREMSVADLLKLNARFSPPSQTLVPSTYPAPIVDGHLIPRQWDDAVRAGGLDNIPILVGNNAQEGRLFAHNLPVTDVTSFRAALARMFGPLAGAAAKIYPSDNLAEAKQSAIRLIGDQRYVIGAMQLAHDAAAQQPDVWEYRFVRARGDGTEPPTHEGELAYVFGTLDVTPGDAPDAADAALSEAMMRYWTRFAATGNPNQVGLPAWPAARTGQELILNSRISAGPPADPAAIILIAKRYTEKAEESPTNH